MVGNPYRYRAALNQLQNRHATAGCLLAALFVIPFIARLYSMAVLAPGVLIYVFLVVPLATGYISTNTVIGRLRLLCLALLDTNVFLYYPKQILLCLLWLHRIYTNLDSIHTTTNQVLFNLLCEKVFCPDQRMAALYVLLFYTVLAYLQRSLRTRQWTQLLHENTTVDFLKLTTAFIVVRLGKGVVMSLVLLTFTLQFNHLEPTFTYIFITALYFLLTQFKGEAGEETAMVEATRKLGLHILEGMEEYWLPLIISAAAVFMSTVVLCMALLELNVLLLCLLVGYANVYVAGLQMMENCWKPLSVQNAVVAVFPLASPKKLEQRGDTLCPVCLDDMRILTARVTPCNHIFHTSCLRKCVLQFGQCPLCKQPL